MRLLRETAGAFKKRNAAGWQISGVHALAQLLSCMLLQAFCAAFAQAHDGAATSFASITIAESRVLYSLTTSGRPAAQDSIRNVTSGEFPGDAARIAALVSRDVHIDADGHRCIAHAANYEPPLPPRTSTTYNVEFHCDAPIRKLRVTDDLFDVIGRDAHTLLRVIVAGREQPITAATMLSDGQRTAEFNVALAADSLGDESTTGERRSASASTDLASAASEAPAGAISFFPLGIQHILEGWDHMLFLLALVLPGGSLGNLLRIVTAFTVAHSLTLALAALEIVSVPPAPIEALIALSIAWVAAENLVRIRPMSRRWLVAFGFGLIHGFGFSNVLRDIGLLPDALLASLLWFNLGIETGQLLVVALLVPSLAWLSRRAYVTRLPKTVSVMILIASVMLVVQRV